MNKAAERWCGWEVDAKWGGPGKNASGNSRRDGCCLLVSLPNPVDRAAKKSLQHRAGAWLTSLFESADEEVTPPTGSAAGARRSGPAVRRERSEA